MKPKFILVVGLQKSGTFLLRQLLAESGLVEHPFEEGEGQDFWGNVPPFTPRGFPAGTIYQRSGGEMGHEIGEEDATQEIKNCLLERLANLEIQSSLIVNKNPYNVLRIPWLRKLFPDSFIVGIVRKPVPNVFSLLKRFTCRQGYRYEPEEGWWGVKPKNWQQLIDNNKIIQCAHQWKAVNGKLLQDQNLLNLIVSYDQVCSCPLGTVEKILSLIEGKEVKVSVDYPVIQCFDDEYQRGARLLSKKRSPDGSAVLDSSWLQQEKIEIQALQETDIALIEEICAPVSEHFFG
ncbi:MAG: sulfotransferase [Moorea sp. SIOASIH]|uniref:sulfotransferase family protein n=1 Tax=Moorena sp. SIOASIH TaxID=2607817 RepID=UPI0013B62197|nr:sulfotransferase [Moorena sp. SIOASIH]NEO38729.1 sulfotransferase [Moorena sp. SIOASIH]